MDGSSEQPVSEQQTPENRTRERPGSSSFELNERAARIADRMAENAGRLGIAVSRLDGGARVLDCGIAVPGGLEAGRLLAEACMGAAGHVAFAPLALDRLRLPGVQVWTDHPAIACLASQYAGWAIQPPGYFAMGSGPLRAMATAEKELFGRLGYTEARAGRGVLILESRSPPDDRIAAHIAREAGIPADVLTLLIAPTASLAAGVQISARVVETGLHKLHELGFDVNRVVSAWGAAPIAPVAGDDLRAIGRTNDCVLYGGSVHFSVRADDDELARLVPRIPSSASSDYGTPFYDLFERYERDFYKVDPHLFSPAEVYVTNLASGRTFHAGGLDVAVLRTSLLA